MDFELGSSRVKAIVGHFGSGKTEIALNIALMYRNSGRKSRVIDVDIVNPFFRSAECAEKMRELGVEVLYPEFALSAVDMPVLGAEIRRAFANDGVISVLDVGGDETGAAALGGFKTQLDEARADVFYVINPFRPRSCEIGQVLSLMELVEQRSRIKITGIIANANMGGETTAEIIDEGRRLIALAANEAGLPVVAECGLASARPNTGEWRWLSIERYLVPEWMEE